MGELEFFLSRGLLQRWSESGGPAAFDEQDERDYLKLQKSRHEKLSRNEGLIDLFEALRLGVDCVQQDVVKAGGKASRQHEAALDLLASGAAQKVLSLSTKTGLWTRAALDNFCKHDILPTAEHFNPRLATMKTFIFRAIGSSSRDQSGASDAEAWARQGAKVIYTTARENSMLRFYQSQCSSEPLEAYVRLREFYQDQRQAAGHQADKKNEDQREAEKEEDLPAELRFPLEIFWAPHLKPKPELLPACLRSTRRLSQASQLQASASEVLGKRGWASSASSRGIPESRNLDEQKAAPVEAVTGPSMNSPTHIGESIEGAAASSQPARRHGKRLRQQPAAQSPPHPLSPQGALAAPKAALAEATSGPSMNSSPHAGEFIMGPQVSIEGAAVSSQPARRHGKRLRQQSAAQPRPPSPQGAVARSADPGTAVKAAKIGRSSKEEEIKSMMDAGIISAGDEVVSINRPRGSLGYGTNGFSSRTVGRITADGKISYEHEAGTPSDCPTQFSSFLGFRSKTSAMQSRRHRGHPMDLNDKNQTSIGKKLQIFRRGRRLGYLVDLRKRMKQHAHKHGNK